jgi:hypothetical protein
MRNETSLVLLLTRIKVIGRKGRILRRMFAVAIRELGMLQKTVYRAGSLDRLALQRDLSEWIAGQRSKNNQIVADRPQLEKCRRLERY